VEAVTGRIDDHRAPVGIHNEGPVNERVSIRAVVLSVAGDSGDRPQCAHRSV
jgi:hypothetical protein